MKKKTKVERLRNEADRLEKQSLLRIAKANGWKVEHLPAKAAQINRLRCQAAAALIGLERLAEKDLNALGTLATELLFHVRRMNQNALGNLDFVRTLTRHCATWPATVSADKDIQKQQTALAEQLQLGMEANENYAGRQWSRRTPEVRAALRVLQWLAGNKIVLPRFTRATSPAWWKAGRKIFVQIYGTDFEKHELFKSYWTLDFGASLSQKTFVRKRILDKMAQAFHSIAHKN